MRRKSHMRRKNTIQVASTYWKVYFYGFFRTHALINFLIPLMEAEVITLENFVPENQDPVSAKERRHLAGMKLFTCNRRI